MFMNTNEEMLSGYTDLNADYTDTDADAST